MEMKRPEHRRYIVALMSNVLRKNSAWDHSRLGAAIEEIVLTRRATAVRGEGSDSGGVALTAARDAP